MPTAAQILGEVQNQETRKVQGSPKSLLDQVVKELGIEAGEAEVDVLTYVRAEWGLCESPYPIQRFILKIIYALALDDRPDSEVFEVISSTSFICHKSQQFDRESIIDIGRNKAVKVKFVGTRGGEVVLETEPKFPIEVGDLITARIVTWDKFRETVEGAYTEKEFLKFLYADGPGTEDCRINLSPEEYEDRVLRKKAMNMVVLRIGRRGTKCLNKDTLCFTNKGLLSLDELRLEEGIEVPNARGSLKGVSLVYDNGKAETIKVRTSLGNVIEGTSEHKLWVMNEEGDLEWRKLRDLKLGDCVTLSRKNEGCFGDKKSYSLKQFELWGLWLGDGCVTESQKTCISLQCATDDNGREKELYTSYLRDVLGREPTWVPDLRIGKRTGRLSVGAFGKGTSAEGCVRYEWIRLGFGYDVKEKRLPKLIRTASKDQIAGFLRGFFEADGCASGSRKIFACNKGYLLMEDIQLLLQMYGVASNRRSEVVNGETYWRVEIHTNRDRKLFMDQIGFLSDKKIGKGRSASSSSRETDEIPNQKKYLRYWWTQLKSYGSGRDPQRRFFRGMEEERSEGLSWDKMRKALDAFPQDVSGRSHFEELAEADYIYARVESLERSEAETLDLSVPDGRTYVASGLVTHNTTLSQWIAAYTAYRIIRKYHPQSFYRTRLDQAISMTLIATGKEQAQDLLAPARSAMKRSPYLRRFVVADSERRMTLNTPYNVDHGLGAENGIKIIAAPCSAKAVRGPANILALLEEYGQFYWELEGSNKSDKSIYNAISPSLADLTDPVTGEPAGMMMVISTPLTRESHMFELEQLIWEGKTEFPNALVLHLPSFWTNRLLSSAKLKEDFAIDPVSFHQEYEAYYSDQRQQALTRDEVDGCRIDPSPTDEVLQSGEDTFMGFDLGLKNDPSSITIVAMNGEGKGRIVHHETISVSLECVDYLDDENPNCLDIVKVAKRVDELWTYWNCRKGMADQWNSYGLKPHLRSGARTNLSLTEVNTGINDRVAKNFLSYIYQRNLAIYLPREAWNEKQSLLRELVRLQRVESSRSVKRIKLEAPNIKGAHDDQYSSLSRALFCGQEEISERPPAVTGMSKAHGKRVEINRQKIDTLRRQTVHAKNSGRVAGKTRGIGRR